MKAAAEMRMAVCNRPNADQTKLATVIVGDSSCDGKAVASLTAQFALLGYSRHAPSDESFVACRWGCSRLLQSTYEARRFCRQLGGAA